MACYGTQLAVHDLELVMRLVRPRTEEPHLVEDPVIASRLLRTDFGLGIEGEAIAAIGSPVFPISTFLRDELERDVQEHAVLFWQNHIQSVELAIAQR